MKKSISIFLCLALILSSFSFAFATPTSWDTTDQANLRYIMQSLTSSTGTVVSALNSIITNTNTIANHLNTIKSYLVDGGYSISYWVHAINTWMSPIYNSIQAIPVDLERLVGGLFSVVTDSSGTTYTPYLFYGGKSNANWLSDIYSGIKYRGNLAFPNGGLNYLLPMADGSYYTQYANTNYQYWQDTMNFLLQQIQDTLARTYAFEFNHRDQGYNSLQSLVSFADPDSTVTFTPLSATDGLYKYLNAINTPLARLGYVLASDSRIEAQEASAANEQAVVDNFIDPNGSGAASTSDFDSIADFSSGYQSTFSSDASPTGIFNLFTSDNMSWFSQETVNQLDTSNSNNRAKSDNTFNTPLLDQQINSIYEQLGVKQP